MIRNIGIVLLPFVWLLGCTSAEDPEPAQPGDAASSEAAPDAASADGAPAAAAEDESVTLFDGTNLDRWNILGDANWELVNDYVRADTGNGFLVSDLAYDNFELTLEFFVNVEANSGVFIRCQDPEQIGAANCYEVNIFDTRADQTYRTGGIVDFAAPAAIINTGGRWNSYEIVADGSRLLVTLNGTVTVDIEDETMSSGPFALQYGAGAVMFRNVRVRSL
ncbi:3-keto-disaccharide hydrolase [Candidatus Rariloculus sp.]|uniref:3-keto-disaccharide hydrolase n=1 Tax=Candidatus Rariloculus sp. TaxID=3101265 RepID=UPI003D12A290